MKAVLYLRVSTRDQNLNNQELELRAAAARMGHTVVDVYQDFGISGAKGRDKRPAFDRLHKAIARKDFDIVMAWSVDRLGRSLRDLIAFIDELHTKNVGLFLHQQGIDTTTPAGKAMFSMLGVFAEFERAIIRERISAGIVRAQTQGTRSGRPHGRAPAIDAKTLAAVKAEYAKQPSVRRVAAKFKINRESIRRALAA